MNTLKDGHGGKARPSVWPVYLTAAVIVAASLWYLFQVGYELIMGYGGFYPPLSIATQIAHGLFGGFATLGLIRLRPWGWWCAVIWGIAFVLSPYMLLLASWSWVWVTPPYADYVPSTLEGIVCLLLWAVPIALLVWPLATRRRLFFPTKAEREG